MTIQVGVIGCGYWGPNLVRNFAGIEGFDLKVVADLRQERLELVRRRYPAVQTTTNTWEVLAAPEIDAVAIATPVSTHFELAREALLQGKHVLLEKPMSAMAVEARELVHLARAAGLTLLVDHTFIYTGAVRKIREIIDSGELGEVLYFDSVRVNLGLFQHDVNVVWDLAPHDFSILTYLIDKRPVGVSAIGVNHVPYNASKLETMAYVTVTFEDNTLAHFHLNWLSPVKIRRTLIGGSKKLLVYDQLSDDEQVKVYDAGVTTINTDGQISRSLIQYRTGDTFSPKVDRTEALELECRHFLQCILSRQTPTTDGEFGMHVVTLLEAAAESLKRGGQIVHLEGPVHHPEGAANPAFV
jgi:predicted dehydrogenase